MSEVSEQTTDPSSFGATLERSRDEVLNNTRPFPWDDEMVIDDLTEEEETSFLAALRDT